jgi:hypothetical protein
MSRFHALCICLQELSISSYVCTVTLMLLQCLCNSKIVVLAFWYCLNKALIKIIKYLTVKYLLHNNSVFYLHLIDRLVWSRVTRLCEFSPFVWLAAFRRFAKDWYNGIMPTDRMPILQYPAQCQPKNRTYYT